MSTSAQFCHTCAVSSQSYRHPSTYFPFSPAGTLTRSLACVRVDGFIYVIGLLSGGAEIDPMPILRRMVTVQGVYVGSREMFEAMNRAIETHQLRPVIDRSFPLEDTRDAFAYFKSQAHFGKVVIALE